MSQIHPPARPAKQQAQPVKRSALPHPQYQQQAEAWMRQALQMLEPGQADVPVAALIFDANQRLIGAGINQREATGDPTAHAEVLAIRQAVGVQQDGWRLEDCTLVVTLEPCAMCAGAILNSRISKVYFGAYEDKTGACGSVVDILRDPILQPTPEVQGGILEAECAQVLLDFFDDIRRKQELELES